MDEKSIENLRNWLRERRNKQLDRAYRDARRYLGIPVLSQNFSSDSASSVTGTEKIFFAASSYTFEDLDNAINSTLLFCLRPECADKKISQLTDKKWWAHSDQLADLWRMKQELLEQALFLKYLPACLDTDPFACCNNLYFDCEEFSPDVLRSVTMFRRTTKERVQSLLDGIALFLKTPVEKIPCMPRHAAILLKMAAPCWIFLGLNLPNKDQPTQRRMERFLSSTSQSSSLTEHSSLDRVLKCFCTAFKSCLAVCGGPAFSDVIMKKYSLTDYVDEKILLGVRCAFIRASMSWVSSPTAKKAKRALDKRDVPDICFDKKLPLSEKESSEEASDEASEEVSDEASKEVSDEASEEASEEASDEASEKAFNEAFKEYIQVLFDEALNCIPARSGPQIEKNFAYLSIFQKILSSIHVKAEETEDFEPFFYRANETFNFLLFEHITHLTSIAVRGFGSCNSPNSFFFPPEITSECILSEYEFPSKVNPFYTPKEDFRDFVNNLQFDLDRFYTIRHLRMLLSHQLNPPDVKTSWGEVQSMQDYLGKLFHVYPLISIHADKEFYGLEPEQGK